LCSLRLAVSCVRGDAAALAHWPLNAVSLQSGHNDAVAFRRQWRELLYNLSGSFFCEDEGTGGFQDELPNPASRQGRGVNAGARLHRFPEQRCINDAAENALEHGLASWASGWGQIVFGRVCVVAA